MKKLLSIVVILLVAFSFSACISELPTTDSVATATPDANTAPDPTPTANAAPTATPTPTTSNKIVFEELTVIDNEQCTIKITKIDPDNIWGYTLKAYFENKTSDKNFTFSVVTASINGVECDPFFACDVAAGKKSNNDLYFSTDTLEENGITDFTDIEISFRVYDADDWYADDIATVTTHVYPYGEDKATSYVRETKDTDLVLVDNEYVTVILTDYEKDGFWGYTVNLFLVNKTTTEVMFSADDVSVNGYMLDPFWAESVCSKKCAFTSISWSDSDFEENGITEVEEIEFMLRAYNYNDWFSGDYVNQKITLKP